MLVRAGDFALNLLIGGTIIMGMFFLGLAVGILLLPRGPLP